LKESNYYLICLMEEAAEVVQAASKCLRFGSNDSGPGTCMTNFERLEEEMSQLTAVSVLASVRFRGEAYDDKLKAMDTWLSYSRERNVITNG